MDTINTEDIIPLDDFIGPEWMSKEGEYWTHLLGCPRLRANTIADFQEGKALSKYEDGRIAEWFGMKLEARLMKNKTTDQIAYLVFRVPEPEASRNNPCGEWRFIPYSSPTSKENPFKER